MAVPTRGPTYKVVLLGELGVGKTSLFRRLKDNTFDEYQTATTGIDSCTRVVKVDGETVMVSAHGCLLIKGGNLLSDNKTVHTLRVCSYRRKLGGKSPSVKNT